MAAGWLTTQKPTDIFLQEFDPANAGIGMPAIRRLTEQGITITRVLHRRSWREISYYEVIGTEPIVEHGEHRANLHG